MNKYNWLLLRGVSAVAILCATNTAFATEVTTEAGLADALTHGTSVTLGNDINLSGNLPEATTGTFTVDGNMHTLVGNGHNGFLVGAGAAIDLKNIKTSDVEESGFSRVLNNAGTVSIFDAIIQKNGNSVTDASTDRGGVVYNTGTINEISASVFRENSVTAATGDVSGGAILNQGTIKDIKNSEFMDNSAVGENGNAYGGAIANVGGQALTITNTSFYNNFASAGGTQADAEGKTSANRAAGGAIYSNGDLNIVADGKDVVFSGNYVSSEVVDTESGSGTGGGGAIVNPDGGDVADGEEGPVMTNYSNAITMFGDGLNLNLLTNNGNIIFDDGIDGGMSALKISGNGEVVFNNSVDSIGQFLLNDSHFVMGNGVDLSVASYEARGNNSMMTVTVDPDAKSASLLTVAGDVVGTTSVVVKATSATVISEDERILFVSAEGDNPSTEANFVVYRVYGSPYMWKTSYTAPEKDDESGGGGGFFPKENIEDEEGVVSGGDSGPGNTGVGGLPGWYLSMTDDSNPNFRPMAPEIAAFMALPSAAIEQNRGVTTSVRNSVANNKFMLKRYGVMYENQYKGHVVSNLWANPVYRYVNVTAPQEWDASIAGFDMGLDLQSDASNKVGVFGSYRYGTYDINGEGKFHADMGSNLEISSYLLGMYYRYDYNNFWAFTTAYAGKQHAEIDTDDHVKTEADGTQYGAGLEVGYAYIPGYNWTLEPSLGVFYTGIDYDEMEDDYGKSAKYSMLSQIEGEFGIKLEKTVDLEYGYSKIYVKPSIVQTVNFGNEIKITHVGKVDALDNQTLGRIEIGGRMALDSKMSLYSYANYTAGSDYNDIGAGLGFSYRWY